MSDEAEGTHQGDTADTGGTSGAGGAGDGLGSSSSRVVWIAGAVVLVVLLVGGGLLIARRDNGSDQPGATRPRTLSLVASAAGNKDSLQTTAGAEPSLFPAQKTEYRLEGTLPDLGKTSVVWKLNGPNVDATFVNKLAQAFGVPGGPRQVAEGWQVEAGDAFLAVRSVGGAQITFGRTTTMPGISGSSGGGVSSGSSGAASGTASAGATTSTASNIITTGRTAGAVPGATTTSMATPPHPTPGKPPVEPGPPPVSTPPVTTPPMTAPANLPSAADAQRIAHQLLANIGAIGDDADWRIEVTDGSTYGVATSCAVGFECPPSPPPVVTSRRVTFHRLVNGVEVTGLEWTVEVGDRGAIQSADGVIGTLDSLGEYPLRSTNDVFADLQADKARYVSGRGMPLGVETMKSAIATDNSVSAAESAPASTTIAKGGVPTTVAPFRGAPTSASPNELGANGPTQPSGAPSEPPSTGTGDSVPGNPGDGIAPGEPNPGDGQTIVEPPISTPPPIVITITGAKLGLGLVTGSEDGKLVTYLVPTYRYSVKAGANDTSTLESNIERTIELIALDPSFLNDVQPPPTPQPLGPSGPDTPVPGGPGGPIMTTATAILVPQPAPAPIAVPTTAVASPTEPPLTMPAVTTSTP